MPSYPLQELYHDLAEGVPELNADTLGGEYEGKIRAVAGGEVVASYDPSESTTALKDAVAAVAAADRPRGYVQLPCDDMDPQEFEIDLPNYCGVVGAGVEFTKLRTTGSPSYLFRWTGGSALYRGTFGGFSVMGPGDDAAACTALWLDDGGISNSVIRPLRFEDLYGSVLRCETTGREFQNVWESINWRNVDAGDENAVLDWVGGHASSEYHLLAGSPSATTSGVNSHVLSVGGNGMDVGTISVDGTTGMIADHRNNNNGLAIGRVHYEPNSQVSAQFAMFDVGGQAPFRVEEVNVKAGSVGRVYRTSSAPQAPENKEFGSVLVAGGSVTQNIVEIDNAPAGPLEYHGPLADCADDTGGLTAPNTVYALDGNL